MYNLFRFWNPSLLAYHIVHCVYHVCIYILDVKVGAAFSLLSCNRNQHVELSVCELRSRKEIPYLTPKIPDISSVHSAGPLKTQGSFPKWSSGTKTQMVLLFQVASLLDLYCESREIPIPTRPTVVGSNGPLCKILLKITYSLAKEEVLFSLCALLQLFLCCVFFTGKRKYNLADKKLSLV